MQQNVSTQPIIPYSISLTDVQAYLDSKADGDVIGVTYSEDACLLVNAFRAKYPQAQKVSCYYARIFVDGQDFRLTEDLHDLYLRFDKVKQIPDSDFAQVTKREWLQHVASESEGRS